jgi:hypothetical protein
MSTIGLSLENPNHYSAVLLVEEIRIHGENLTQGLTNLSHKLLYEFDFRVIIVEFLKINHLEKS